MSSLHREMSVEEFDNGYFYAAELKAFARDLGIIVGNFRKFELEELIREFLQTGKVPDRKPVLPRKAGKARDVLKADTTVTNYVGDKRTKAFLLELVYAEAPGLSRKSGQWYWLNDWRRKRQEAKECFTYGDLADHLRMLMQTKGRLPRCPSARMNNFITDFMADPANVGTSRKEVLKAWDWLKEQPGPKTYGEFRNLVHAEAPEDSGRTHPCRDK
ncbi:MAG: SAP domain-containing protein [Bacteroidota bacterium]|nr:SAP domain-containing protein [Bacteroidota bacterium]MXW14568.1 hypothetical protein [Rhodothermaceae bacterium]MDE2644606.1 SAP domain-containing protein [Bacteroidota bacterium]MXW31589.1 hypothetical protein [Rhodothermaceae bacterium]MYC04535.1 hypothetical protein [Rhodothermaceae bacterium]